jgi:hypothetical protein
MAFKSDEFGLCNRCSGNDNEEYNAKLFHTIKVLDAVLKVVKIFRGYIPAGTEFVNVVIESLRYLRIFNVPIPVKCSQKRSYRPLPAL